MLTIHNLTKCTLLILALVLLAFSPHTTHADDEVFKLTAPDPAEMDWFGYSVAVDGTTVVVGIPNDDDTGTDSGAAYVYDCGSFPCTQISKLTASDAAEFDYFGLSVAVSGTTVVVGAPWDDDGGKDSGAAYIYNCSEFSCREVDKLIASNPNVDALFGWSAAVDRASVMIGAPGDDNGGEDSGAAYIYTCRGTSCTELSKLIASDAAKGATFGNSVAINGATVVVGAPGDNDGGEDSGAAYIYDCGNLFCREINKLTASDAAEGSVFGNSVAINGATVVVGAPGDNGYYSGSAYIYDCNISPCTEGKLTVSNPGQGHSFGFSVALDGTLVVIGALGDDGKTQNSGAAYIYNCSSTTCTEISKLIASDIVAGDVFGFSVALDGSLIVIGALGKDDGGRNSGAAYVFDISPDP